MTTIASLQETIKKKDAIEEEITAIVEALNSPGLNGAPPAGLSGNLVDAEGFPRADIDIHGVRNLRHRLACLRTDHKAIMKTIEEGLHQIHQERKPASEPTSKVPPQGTPDAPRLTAQSPEHQVKAHVPTHIPFARVHQVFEGSPAAEAGFKVGDEIVKFGGLMVEQGKPRPVLKDLIPVVNANVDAVVTVHVLRLVEMVQQLEELQLTPHTWSGAGLLGCHVLPVE